MDQWDFYEESRRQRRPRIHDHYEILGFLSSGTYGRVYKAKALLVDRERDSTISLSPGAIVAIKKFKPDRDGDIRFSFNGISQSACREISLCRELHHSHIVKLHQVLVEPLDRSISMVFDYAEHDLLQILHHHNIHGRCPIPEQMIKSLLKQLLEGLDYLHKNWVMHRDLKPANLLVTADGTLQIGDLGLARIFQDPVQPLVQNDRVVVTIWYRAPELLLGARHYTPAIDCWAVGCIFAELYCLKPVFKGEEIKPENKKQVPFQKIQYQKIIELLGSPTENDWDLLPEMPEYHHIAQMETYPDVFQQYLAKNSHFRDPVAYNLLSRLLDWDPTRRLTPSEALQHPFFLESPLPEDNVFRLEDGSLQSYPLRKMYQDEKSAKNGIPLPSNISMASNATGKASMLSMPQTTTRHYSSARAKRPAPSTRGTAISKRGRKQMFP